MGFGIIDYALFGKDEVHIIDWKTGDFEERKMREYAKGFPECSRCYLYCVDPLQQKVLKKWEVVPATLRKEDALFWDYQLKSTKFKG